MHNPSEPVVRPLDLTCKFDVYDSNITKKTAEEYIQIHSGI